MSAENPPPADDAHALRRLLREVEAAGWTEYVPVLKRLVEKNAEHHCIWCPVEVRDLHACAHNAVVNYGTERERKKMAGLAEAVKRYQPIADAHFADGKKARSVADELVAAMKQDIKEGRDPLSWLAEPAKPEAVE